MRHRACRCRADVDVSDTRFTVGCHCRAHSYARRGASLLIFMRATHIVAAFPCVRLLLRRYMLHIDITRAAHAASAIDVRRSRLPPPAARMFCADIGCRALCAAFCFPYPDVITMPAARRMRKMRARACLFS